jgi:hypothetical protein
LRGGQQQQQQQQTNEESTTFDFWLKCLSPNRKAWQLYN